MPRNYVLTKGAVGDLKEIVRYTNEQWGEGQCRLYICQLEEAASALAKGEGIFKDMSALHPHMRMIKSGAHYIFCLNRPDTIPAVLAIFHERRDIMARLKNRLT